MPRYTDDNGLPTVAGARAMFAAMDEARAHREAFAHRLPFEAMDEAEHQADLEAARARLGVDELPDDDDDELQAGPFQGPEVIYRWDDGRVVVDLDGVACGPLRLRPELLQTLPPELDDLARRRVAAAEGPEVLRELADRLVLAISLAMHAHDDNSYLAAQAFPGVLSLLDDHAPIGPGWGTDRDTVRRRGAMPPTT